MTKGRRTIALVALALSATGATQFGRTAVAASLAETPALAQAHVDARLRGIMGGVSLSANWKAEDDAATAAGVCASTREMKVAVLPRQLSAGERKACDVVGRRAMFQRRIGSVIVAPVAQPGAFAQLTMKQLVDALLAQDASGQPNKRAKWKDVDPSLPDVAIQLLLPRAGTPEDVALSTALASACLAQRAGATGASASARIAACATLRSDSVVTRATEGQRASSWLASGGAGAVALVGYGQIAADAALTGIVPLDGMLPTAESRARGEYPASMPIYLVASHYGRNPLENRDQSPMLADAILAEATIGPEGRAAAQGLAPLPADNRVALRRDFSRFLSKGGVWE